MTFPNNTTVSPHFTDEGSGYVTQPHIQYSWPSIFEPQPCSCEYAGRHLWLIHWLRMKFMRRSWE